ncbi:tetratricopeptide repeat protein [Nostoc sp.]|uniref:tetratricopeptide repeat protein n=1 Tax=Nostoc sp. TaxID=1180 RepID=UPI002FF46C77
MDEYEKAIEDFTQAIDNQADDAKTYYPDAYYKRGLIDLNLGEPEKAIKDFNNAIKCDSKYYKAYYKRAIARHHVQLTAKIRKTTLGRTVCAPTLIPIDLKSC